MARRAVSIALLIGLLGLVAPAQATEGLEETGVEFCNGRVPFKRPGASFERSRPIADMDDRLYVGRYHYRGHVFKVWAQDRGGGWSVEGPRLDTALGSVSLSPPGWYGRGDAIQFIFLCGYTIKTKGSRAALIDFATGLGPKDLSMCRTERALPTSLSNMDGRRKTPASWTASKS